MRGKKSIFAKTLGILLVLIALVMQTVSVYAEDEKCTLNIEYAPDGNKVNDVEFTIYKVGEFDNNTKFSWYYIYPTTTIYLINTHIIIFK